MSHTIDIADNQAILPVNEHAMRQAIGQILSDERIRTATISVAIVDDPTIHELNARFLQHDYPTDALSFVLESAGGSLEGEIIVSAETAARRASEFDAEPGDELLLYVLHGVLHLVGYDDKTDETGAAMRERERYYLSCVDGHTVSGITQP